MLPAKARLTDRDDFTTVVRRGRRAGRGLVVVHVLVPDSSETGGHAADDGDVTDSPEVSDPRFDSSQVAVSQVEGSQVSDSQVEGSQVSDSQVEGSRVGFVVSKAVGGSVVRHRVARRLRHLMRDRLVDTPDGSRIVVRALPAAARAESADLGADLDRALRGALEGKAPARRRPKSDGRRRTPGARPGTPGTPDVPAASSRP